MPVALGIDIGSDKCVVAFVNENGVVDVLQNEASKRETPVVIHFDKRQRLFGSAGAARANMNPQSTISQLKRLIGRRFDEPSFQKEVGHRGLLPYTTSEGENGEITVNVQYLGQEWKFTAVEMLGMFLCYVKRMAEKATASEVSECVIGIPSYFTDKQRRDYLLAAEVAGLKPLRLFHDGAATALDYGIYRNLPYGKETNVVFVDIGHCDTQVTAVKFVSGMAMVLAHSFDRDLGGRDFDNVIFTYLAEKFSQNHNVNVLENPKASFRLWAQCEKVKKILSSNTEAPISIESLMDEKDLEVIITRKKFEELSMSSGLLSKIKAACENVLRESGLLAEQLFSVELVGSGSRIPMVIAALEEFFGQKASRTLNGSECVANGCALQCAMLSSAPKTTPFAVHDIFPFTISLSNSIIVAKGMPLLTTKVFVLHRSKIVILSYVDSKELPLDASTTINQYTFDSTSVSSDADLEVRIQFDRHGIINIYVFIVERSRLSRRPVNDFKPTSGIPIEHILKRAQFLESDLAELDRANENAKHLRNDLESNLFQIRQEVLRTIAQSANCVHISKKLQELEDWLYGPGADGSGDAYMEKMNALNKIRREIEAEHERAITYAEHRRRELEWFTFHKIMRAITGRLQSFTMKIDYGNISAKIRDIEEFLRGELRSEEDYINEMETLKLVVDPIENRYMDAKRENLDAVGSITSVNVSWSPPDNQPPPAMISDQKLACMIKDGYIVIHGCPCLITGISTHYDKDHGPIMCHFKGIDVFNGEKLEMTVPSTHCCYVPIVSFTDYMLFHISDNGFASLRTTTGKPREDIWFSADDYLFDMIKKKLEKREPVMARVISTMGEEQIIYVDLSQSMFRYHQLAGTICLNTTIYFNGRSYDVVKTCTKRAAKLGPAMCQFIGIDIFDGKIVEVKIPSSHYCAIPIVSKHEYRMVGISMGNAILETDSGDSRNDIPVPIDKNLMGLINQQLTYQMNLRVRVISAVGEQLIWSVMLDNPKLDCQQLSSTIRINEIMIIKGRPCVVTDVRPYNGGFLSSAKRSFVGIDIFTGLKLEDTFDLHQYCIVPPICYKDIPLIHLIKGGFTILEFESGNKKVRFSGNESLINSINKKIEDGNSVTATVISVMEQLHFVTIKYSHPLFECYRLAGTIQVNSYIALSGRPCKVTKVNTVIKGRYSEPAECYFVGIDIFDGEELSAAAPSSDFCAIPLVLYIPYQLVQISDEGIADLVSESGAQRNPLLLSTDKKLIGQIRANLADNNIVIVTIMSAMRKEKFHSLYYNRRVENLPPDKMSANTSSAKSPEEKEIEKRKDLPSDKKPGNASSAKLPEEKEIEKRKDMHLEKSASTSSAKLPKEKEKAKLPQDKEKPRYQARHMQ